MPVKAVIVVGVVLGLLVWLALSVWRSNFGSWRRP
jgi:hypothetical protein